MYYNSATDSSLAVVAGTHFNWSKKQVATYLGAGNTPTWARLFGTPCSGMSEGGVSQVFSYKDVRPDADCD
jgi:hypothetical protein